MVKAGGITDDPEATFMISYAHREEKGSDVNVATHLLIDVFNAQVDVAMVISNGSDLSLPIRCARDRVPVGVINPGTAYIAGELKGASSDGAGRHWWRQLWPGDFTAHQLPAATGPYRRPVGRLVDPRCGAL